MLHGHKDTGADFRLTVVAGCDEGPCPKIGSRAARPGHWLVQGTRITDSDERHAVGVIPEHEDIVEIPHAIAVQFARQLLVAGVL